MFVDSHCHLELEDFDLDRETVIAQSEKMGIKYILTVGTEEKYFQKVVEITKKHKTVFGAIGIHPHSSKNFSMALREKIESLFQDKKIVACGEIGLDFYKNYSPRDAQKEVFSFMLELAKVNKMPIVVHSRNAAKETLELIDLFYDFTRSGVIHCFSYDKEVAKKFLDRGFYISIPGTITYSGSTKLIEVVKYVPLERMLIETDAPFLTPQPERGKRNVPWFVKYVLEKVAEIKSLPQEFVGKAMVENFERLFLGGAIESRSCSC